MGWNAVKWRHVPITAAMRHMQQTLKITKGPLGQFFPRSKLSYIIGGVGHPSRFFFPQELL